MIEISVVCITARPKPGLGRLVTSLLHQTVSTDRFELIYGDRQWSTREAIIVQTLSESGLQYQYVRDEPRKPGPCPAGARNACIQRARGRWILCIDDLTYLPKDLLEGHLDLMSQGFDAMCGSYLTLKDDGTIENEDERVLGRKSVGMKDQLIHLSWWGMHMGFTKDAWGDVNGFDEAFDGVYGMEDIDFGHRLKGAGKALAWEPALKVLCERGSRHNDTHVQLLTSKMNAPTSWFRGGPVWRNDKLIHFMRAANVVRGERDERRRD